MELEIEKTFSESFIWGGESMKGMKVVSVVYGYNQYGEPAFCIPDLNNRVISETNITNLIEHLKEVFDETDEWSSECIVPTSAMDVDGGVFYERWDVLTYDGRIMRWCLSTLRKD